MGDQFSRLKDSARTDGMKISGLPSPSLCQDLRRGLSLFGNSIVHTREQLLSNQLHPNPPLLLLLQLDFAQGQFLKFPRLRVLLSLSAMPPGNLATVAASPVFNGSSSSSRSSRSCFHDRSMFLSPPLTWTLVPTAPRGSSVSYRGIVYGEREWAQP